VETDAVVVSVMPRYGGRAPAPQHGAAEQSHTMA
jgi:hypothetical protein